MDSNGISYQVEASSVQAKVEAGSSTSNGPHRNKERVDVKDESKGSSQRSEYAERMSRHWENEFRRESSNKIQPLEIREVGSEVEEEMTAYTDPPSEGLSAQTVGMEFKPTAHSLTKEETKGNCRDKSSSSDRSINDTPNGSTARFRRQCPDLSHPGAYAEAGPGTQTCGRRSSAEGEVLEELRHTDNTLPTSREGEPSLDQQIRQSSTSIDGSSTSLVKAERVEDAEAIFYAKDVRMDRFKYYVGWGSVLFLCVVAAVVVTVVTVTERNEDAQGPMTGDPICWKTIEEQNVFERCFCTNTTGHMLDELTSWGRQLYEMQFALFWNSTLVPILNSNNESDIDPDSCHSINQVIMNFAKGGGWGLSLDEIVRVPQDTLFGITVLSVSYVELDGIHWHQSNNWNENGLPCDWHGVGCLFIDDIHMLKLAGNRLSGSIPAAFGIATGLRVLDLSSNDIAGTIPTVLSYLYQLDTLLLSSLSLTGTIPLELGALDRLGILNLEDNQLMGSIPVELFKLSSLRELSLSNNDLSGSLPSGIGEEPTQIAWLDLAHNLLSGMLPTELTRLSNLELLNIGNNSFSGTIPAFLGDMPRLQYINLYQSGLTGSIPSTFCKPRVGSRAPEIIVECAITPECTCCNEGSAMEAANIRIRCAEDVPDQMLDAHEL